MSNLKTITKYTFKEQFFPFMPSKILSKYPKNYPARLLLFAFTYIFFGIFFWFFAGVSGTIYITGQNNEPMYFAMFGVMLTLLLLVMYIPQMLASFFKSEEINILRTWPVGEGELYMGKFLGVILGNIDFILFFLIYLGVYFNSVGFSLSQLIFGIINFFNLLIIPYAIVTGLILLLLKFTNIGSHKKLIKNLGYILLFVFIGVIYYFSFRSGEDPNFEAGSLNAAVTALAPVSNIFFNAKLFGLAMTGTLANQLKYTLILLAISGLICFILYKLADNFYFDAISESGSSKKRKEVASSDIDFSPKTQTMAVFNRDIKNLFSNIVFLSQAITFVVIFGVMSVTMGAKFIAELDFTEETVGMFRFWLFTGGFLISSLIWATSGFGHTSLSREHKSFYLFQTLPISPASHYNGRFLSTFFATEIFNLVLAAIFSIFAKIGLINGILVFLGMNLGAFFSTALGLWMGSTNINTTWKKPEELTRGGSRFIIIYIISMAFVFAISIAYGALLGLTGNHNLVSLIILGVIVLVSFLIVRISVGSYEKGFYDV